MIFTSFDREKCLLSIGDFEFFKLVQMRRQFWQKATDLVNKMVEEDITQAGKRRCIAIEHHRSFRLLLMFS